LGAFRGFGPDALKFFKALAFHQTKEWFEANRAIYEEQVRAPFGLLIEDVSAGLKKHGVVLSGDPKKALFRLNRDVRFSKDKSPYKTHAGATLTRTGEKKDFNGLLYIHVDPQGCFLAAGFYHPEPPVLKALRASIRGRPERFRALVARLKRHKLTLSQEDALTRLPRDFADVEEEDLVAALKLKSFIVRESFPDGELTSPKLVDRIVRFGRAIDPLIIWGKGEDMR
jgi:uncharacterized protein (TIGR02453 family)